MKKTLAAVAVLGAFAGSALAADVTLYGVVDEGLGYTHFDGDNFLGVGESDSFELKSGQQSGSRFGLKGTEDLGNGVTVGFILENGFTADNGADNATFFDRESSLFIQGAFGKLAAGRLGSINQGTSSWGKIGMITAFGTSSWGGYSASASNIFSSGSMMNNTIAYETPSFAGFKVYAQYSMGENGAENESMTDRYYALGATYENGPVAAYFAVDSTNYQTAKADGTGMVTNSKDLDDSLTVTLGGSYDFEVAKVYFGAQYFDEAKLTSIGGLINDVVDATEGHKIKGYSLSLSTSVPVAGGNAMFGIGYIDGEGSDYEETALQNNIDLTRYVVSAGYTYDFSKRTNLYTAVSYMQDQVEGTDVKNGKTRTYDNDLSAYTFVVGLRHKF